MKSKKQRLTKHKLAKIALEILTVPGASVGSEQHFNAAGYTINERHTYKTNA